MRVVIFTLSLGAGHNRSAAQFSARLESQGCDTKVVDVLSLYPLFLGRLVRHAYSIQLKYWPRSYDRAFKSYGQLKGRFGRANSALIQWKLNRLLKTSEIDVIVANNPHAICGIGRLSYLGKVSEPLIAQVLDAGVHPLWINNGGAHLMVHQVSVPDALAEGAGSARVIGPMVASVDRRPRAWSRRVFVSAGSWGVGNLDATVKGILDAGFTPVVMCGANQRLMKHLSRRSDVEAVGWTDDVASVMLGCTAVVDNAGGLTGWEALNLGVPVIGFKPIAGHGLLNLEKMAEAGLITFANNESELEAALGASATQHVSPVFTEPDLKRVLEDLIGADRL